jgi:hypothetical protein
MRDRRIQMLREIEKRSDKIKKNARGTKRDRNVSDNYPTISFFCLAFVSYSIYALFNLV